MIAKHLRTAHNVILDCPLSHQSHFDLLKQAAVHENAELVIVDCRPQGFKWKEWINQRQGTRSSSGAQFKTETWEDVKKSYGERYGDYDTGNIRKVIVDTTMPSLNVFNELISPSLPSRGSNSRGSGLLSRTIKELKSAPIQVQIMNHHHVLNIVNQTGRETDKRGYCYGCQKTIACDSAFYRCNQCRFRLHKLCAEAPGNLERLIPCSFTSFEVETIKISSVVLAAKEVTLSSTNARPVISIFTLTAHFYLESSTVNVTWTLSASLSPHQLMTPMRMMKSIAMLARRKGILTTGFTTVKVATLQHT
ncbi:hypothetical protein HS088_TW06G00110 [Tripterygium wilfordii]|uniref:DC1 domain-containing protein n=1 Tax=Tripterygium wilfordii TaxID=458696 RepID=A0A7J7DHV4_TRIWF|nr:hypothetical protein HS088_TW06G00110 [Tripterygium wilfordii]